MSEYQPPNCEDGKCKGYATVHIHLNETVVFLCDSHLRKRTTALKRLKVEFTYYRI